MNKIIVLVHQQVDTQNNEDLSITIRDKTSENGFVDCQIYGYVDPHTGETLRYAFSEETRKLLEFLAPLFDRSKK